jgi:serine/threonine-protein kinase
MAPFDPPLTKPEVAALFPELTIEAAMIAGGQGAVFRAQHASHGAVVLKVIAPHFDERVRREFEALQKIKHPSLLAPLAYGQVTIRGAVCPFTLSPLIEGTDLRIRLQSGPIDEATVKQVLISVADGLTALWERRIVHRDIKPGNILLKSDGTALLIDLGVARHLDMPSLTADGSWLGTPGYMSPEQAAGQKTLSVKSDIFGLGVTAYETLTRIHPFHRDQGLIVRGTTAPRGAQEITTCSEKIAYLLADMMKYNPVLRPMPNVVRQTLLQEG